jgi:hypothetical protein
VPTYTYAATFSAVGMTAAQDVFEIAAGSTRRIVVKEVRIGQYSDAGDAAAEMLSVTVIRGFTTTGAAGSTLTAVKMNPASTRTATATVKSNNTTVAQDGTGSVLLADSWNVQAGAWIAGNFGLAPSTRLVVRITAPADSITTNGTIVWDEIDAPA